MQQNNEIQYDENGDPIDTEYHPKLSVLEQEYMAKAMTRQKKNIVKPQVVAGREFKGTAFISKPDKIIFKDFTVGVSHTQTILLTNVSFSFNSFKLLPLDDKIKDFFHIQYTPTGRMSAGLSTTITITFTPQLNEDIQSHLPILSETGQINIPLICTCKKALIAVEEDEIDLGNVIFGEQCTKYLKLTNTGALSTKIYIKTPDGKTIPFISVEDLQREQQKREQLLQDQQDKLNAKREKEWGNNDDEDGQEQQQQENEGDDKNRASQMTNNKATNQLATAKEGQASASDLSKVDQTEDNELNMDNSYEDPDAIAATAEFDEFIAQVTFKRTTEIDGYSSTRIQFTFEPYKLTEICQNFVLFFQNQDYTKPIPITVKGTCVDVPIYVEKEEYDLNVLIYEQFYRQKIMLFNRGNNSMKIQLFFPKDFKQYLEFNPTLGYIQGNGSFEIWLKFKPDRSILSNCKRYLVKQDEEPAKDPYEEFTMSIPVKVTGANQVLPVKFNIRCVFAVNAISFQPQNINFGNLFNHSASRVTMNMENHSLLPQKFSFVRLPKEIKVVTDDGTGVILPGEKYPIQVEYRPTQLTCYEESNIYVRIITGEISVRELKVSYQANVNKCPLSTDKQKIEFPALPETEFTEVVLQLSNTSQKNFTIEVVPPHSQLSGLTVNPLVKPVGAGRSTLISLKYHSLFRDLTHYTLKDALQPKLKESGPPKGLVVTNKKLAERMLKQKKNSEQPVDTKNAKKQAPPAAKKEPAAKPEPTKKKTPQEIEDERLEEERRVKEAEEEERRKKEELERQFNKTKELSHLGGKVIDFDMEDDVRRSQHYEWLLPIYYKQSDKNDAEVNVMYLEARTTTVKRTLLPNTDTLEFGEVPVAFRKTQEILVKNIGPHEETLRLEPLTPFGSFSVLNAMRTIKPGETRAIVVQFEPIDQQIYEERVVMFSNHTMVSVLLKGTGVRPEVNISPTEGLISFGNVLVNEHVERTFKISNVSSFPVNFELVSEVNGVENINKQKPFTLIPSQGTIKANETYDVKVIFQPDHHSNNYFDVLLINIPNQINAKKIYLRGQSYTRQMFVREFFPFEWRPNQELQRRYEEPLQMLKHSNSTLQKQRIMLEFMRDEDSVKITDNEFLAEQNRVRKIIFGNCRLLDVKLEKNGSAELTPPKDEKYFEVDQAKVTLNGGQDQVVKFTFNPPKTDALLTNISALKGIGQWVESIWECKLIGGFVEPGQPDSVIVEIVLRAYVEQI